MALRYSPRSIRLPRPDSITEGFLTEHQLLLFLAEVTVLVLAARVGGELAARLGMPQVVGELLMGLAIGPSLLGAFWPGGFEALFPADRDQRALLDVVSWLGVSLLVLAAGLETRLGVLRHSGRIVATSWVGGFFLPLVAGFFFGLVVPGSLIGEGISRPVFALFIGTAMSISAIPVIARILLDLGLLKTKVGVLIISTAIADDTAGWILLAVVVGLATDGGVDMARLAGVLAGTAVFLVAAFTVGQWLVRKGLRASRGLRSAHAQTTFILLAVLTGGLLTQAIGVHLVLGCFVVGILIGRSLGSDKEAMDGIRRVGMGFFAPFFFAYTGIKVDLTALGGSTLLVAAAAVAVACLSKLVGGGVGARLGGLPAWEAAAVGAGLNARGAMELVIATIGLSHGIITSVAFAILVLIAILTSLMAAPLLRWFMKRAGA